MTCSLQCELQRIIFAPRDQIRPLGTAGCCSALPAPVRFLGPARSPHLWDAWLYTAPLASPLRRSGELSNLQEVLLLALA